MSSQELQLQRRRMSARLVGYGRSSVVIRLFDVRRSLSCFEAAQMQEDDAAR